MALVFFRRYPELIPLFATVSAGCTGAVYCLIRSATRNPDAAWDRKNNPYPWQRVKYNENVKFYSRKDFNEIENKRPDVPLD